LFSQSAIIILDNALQIASEVARQPPTNSLLPIGARHVLAAYALRTPPGHLGQLLSWGFESGDWWGQMLAFLRSNYSSENWVAIITTPPSSIDDGPGDAISSESIADDWPLSPEPKTQAGTAPSFPDSSDTVESKPSLRTAATAGGPLVGRYTADDPYATANDLLDVEQEASAFGRIVAARDIEPPLAISIFGEWGSGKTYFMRRIQWHVDNLRSKTEETEPRSLFHRDIVQIRFNAWHYIETNLWASLVDYIFSALDNWIQQQAGNDQSRTELIFNRLATAQ
jgi:hypothetical protein